MKKFIYLLIIFITLPVITCYIFVWFYEKPQRELLNSDSGIKQLKWNSIKNKSNKYNVIILGSSRGYSAYSPNIIDSITKLNSYNMCTGSQHIIESVYMFKEILKHQKPKYLVYEIFLPSFRTNPDFYHVFSNAKYMSCDMVLNEFMDTKILDVLFPIIKYKPYLKKGKWMGKSDNSKHLLWIKGYKPSYQQNDSISINDFSPIYSFSNTSTLPKYEIEKYLSILKNICDDHGVKLLCIRAPYPPSRLKLSAKDDTHAYYEELLKDQGVPFYDLNYSSSKVYSDLDFEDYHHMNSFGAKNASIDLAEIIMQNPL